MSEDWRTTLREKGYRLTPQRELILGAVNRLGHATPDEVLAEVRRESQAVNASTVYRTLEVLEEAGGELDAEELFLELEIVAEDLLRPGDLETTPEGELRWRYAARRARVALIDEGLMTKDRPGVWQLAGN